MKTSLVKRSSSVVARLVDQKMMILHPLEGKLHTFNSMGTYIWRLLWKPCTMSYIVERVKKEFKTSGKRVEEDVKQFLEKALKDKLLVRL